MKKISLVILFAGLLLSLTESALAVDLSKLKIKVSPSINQDCLLSDGHDPVWSCFVNDFKKVPGVEALVPTPTIYLRPDVPAPLLPYAFLYSVGQFVAMPYSDQELAAVFNPRADQFGSQNFRHAAANTFAYWAAGGAVTPSKLKFFKAALSR